jgi:antitoxin (DNA-binding transcriptional repressor) of toxin-antitoxin stability system
MLDGMKTITTREFFHSPGLMKSLRPGESIVVTDNGKPALTVTKTGKRRRRTREELEREAVEICPNPRPKTNFTAILKTLKNA